MRATGKTFRLVLRGLADASEGNTVLFVQGVRHPEYVMAMIEPLVYRLHEGSVYISCTTPEITFRVPPEGKQIIGAFRVVQYNQFREDLRAGRYFGLNRRKVKIVYDDCAPDDELREIIGAWLHG